MDQTLLHHVLIRAAHGNRNKNTNDKFLKEKTGLMPVPEKGTGISGKHNVRYRLPDTNIHLINDHGNGNDHARQQKQRLEGIRPYMGFDQALDVF